MGVRRKYVKPEWIDLEEEEKPKPVPNPDYHPSYDPRIEQEPMTYPTSRHEELAELLAVVHPDASFVEPNPESYTFRVRAGSKMVHSLPDKSSASIAGLLKPPAIMRGTDPQDVKAREKRSELRDLILNDITAWSSASNINKANEALRELDLEDIRAGYEPSVFKREDLEVSNNFPLSTSSSRASLFKSSVIPSESDTPSDITSSFWGPTSSTGKNSKTTLYSSSTPLSQASQFTIADSPIRKKFLADILANGEEMAQLHAQGLLVAPGAVSTTTLEKMNQLSLHRIFGLVMQTALVLPWVVGRSVSRTRKGNFWAFESADKKQMLAPAQIEASKQLKKQLTELEDYKKALLNTENPGARSLHWARFLLYRSLIFSFKLLTIYPLRLAYRTLREILIFSYYCVMGPFFLADELYRRSIAPHYKKARLSGITATVWAALAPVTWKRYLAGDKFGTLWDRESGHAEQVLKDQRDAFEKIGYKMENGILGFFHSNRVIGLLLLLFFASCIAVGSTNIDMDQFELETPSKPQQL